MNYIYGVWSKLIDDAMEVNGMIMTSCDEVITNLNVMSTTNLK